MSCQIKEIQEKILEIFIEVDKICNENNLEYFAIGGTCLGAIRHKGFIPWDDDLDIAMPRKDYEKFKRIAEDRLPSNMRIFDGDVSEHYVSLFSKVHNVDTTFIEKGMEKYPDRYTGVYIDIMPLDGIPNNKIIRKVHFFLLLQLQRLNRMRRLPIEYNSSRGKGQHILKRVICKCISVLPVDYFSKQFEKIQAKYEYSTSKDLSYTWSWRASKVVFPKSDFNECIVMPFENIQIRCPRGYDNFLKTLFDDYMKLPPEKDRVPCHSTDIIDLNRPFSYYIQKE